MVKASVIRWILTAGGILIMLLILLSDSSTTAKSIGVILSIILIGVGVIITGPLKKHFEETREGTLRPPDGSRNYRFYR